MSGREWAPLYSSSEIGKSGDTILKSPAHEIAGCPHLPGIDICHGNQASSQQGSDLVGVDPVVLALAAVDGSHVQGMAQDKGNVLVVAEIGEPVPGEHAFRTDDNVFPERLNELEKACWPGSDIPVQLDVALSIQDADIHPVGVQVDSAVKFVLVGVESHEKASLVECCSLLSTL